MDILTNRKSWLLAPLLAAFCIAVIVVAWAVVEPQTLIRCVDNDGRSPLELMTLPLFALIVPLAWLCPPNAGTAHRQCRWALLWSILGVMAIIRETDLHKLAFSWIWPDVTFKGTVFKMRFLLADGVPFPSKLFVLVFFVLFFVAVLLPLVRYMIPLVKGFFRFEPVAWTAATFGMVSVLVLVFDRLPSELKRHGVVSMKDGGHESVLALMKAIEEGGEMVMALIALLMILQSHLLFVAGKGADASGGEVQQ